MRAMRIAQRLAAACLLLPLLCLALAARGADNPAAEWSGAADAARILIENDTRAGYREAQRLQAALGPFSPPAQQARALNLMARVEIYLGLTAKAGEHARNALALAKRHGDSVGQAEADLNLAINSVNEGKIDALVTAATHAVSVVDGTNRPDLMSEALLRMAMMYHRLGQLEESVTMTMQTMEIARRSNNPLALTYAYQGLALSFSLSDSQGDARDAYRKMGQNARLGRSRILEAYALNGLATASINLGDAETAQELIRQAIAMFREVGAPLGVCHAQFNLADMYRRNGKPEQALPLYTEVVDSYTHFDNIVGQWFTLNARSDVYVTLGNQAAAWEDAERAYQLAKRIGLANYISDSAQRLGVLQAARGAHQRAYAYMQEAAKLSAEFTRNKANRRMNELVKRYESESKRRELTELVRSNQLQSAELQQRQLERRWLWGTLGGSMVALAVTAFLLLRLRRSHATIKNLNAGLEQRVQARTSELRLQTRYLRTLIDTLPWRVWFKDTASRYLALNQAAADKCGLGADQLLGRSDQDVLAPALAEALRADDLEVMESRRGKTVEERLDLPAGPSWIETFKAPVLDDDDSVLGTVGFARDISERKAAEVARDMALAEAQRLAKVRSDFLAQMSHELRTPLNGILGYAQILGRDATLDQPQRRAVGVIQHSGEHLLTLINDILDLAKIEAGKLELAPADVALGPLLESIAEMIRVKADQKGLSFACELGPDLPFAIRVDARRLRQVLLNLLSNAVKFTDHGSVKLAVARSAAGALRFEVHDSGVGVDARQREVIFQPFEQTGDAHRRRGGTGLGLAITRQFLNLMGGDIAVEDARGGGSIFWFELNLPTAEGMLEPAAPQLQVSGYEGARRTVLVADDVPENRVLAVDMLERLGFRMLEAADGYEAVAQATAFHPDLILMDILLPVMDGLEATRMLRQLPGLERVPVIAMSAGASSIDRERYLAAGLNELLPKPIDYDSLLERIESLLQLRWVVDAAPPAVAAPDSAMVVPPPAEMAALHQLARIGNMHDILRRAEHIATLDARFGPFVARLSTLAAGFESKALLRFVEACLEPESSA